MEKTEKNLEKLLVRAETGYRALMKERDELARAVDELLEAQRAEAEQMVRLTEQIWQLEAALAKVSAEKNEVMGLLEGVKGSVGKLHSQMNETLSAVAKGSATKLELAARVYEIIQTAQTDDALSKMLADHNRKVREASQKK